MSEEKLTGNNEHSAAEDLALIRRMMQQAQHSAAVDGRYLILWGLVLGLTQAIVTVSTTFMGNTDNQWTLYIWSGMLALGVVLTFILVFKHTYGTVNSGVRIYASVWVGLGLTMILLFILSLPG